jgi:hypothetical protein
MFIVVAPMHLSMLSMRLFDQKNPKGKQSAMNASLSRNA